MLFIQFDKFQHLVVTRKSGSSFCQFEWSSHYCSPKAFEISLGHLKITIGDNYDEFLDNVAVYNYSLTATEITTHFESLVDGLTDECSNLPMRK
jgi:hypothetical protein